MKYHTVFIVIIIFIMFIIGLNIGFSQGFQEGYKNGNYSGYIHGFIIGNETGYIIGFNYGKEIGYNEGYFNGNISGYFIGFDDGKRIGYEEGYLFGNSSGYSLGFNEGYFLGYKKGVIDGAGRGYTIRDPTYEEVMEFIAMDQTDKNEYIQGKYECVDFAKDVKNNAFNKGYKCGFVLIFFPQGGHAVVCFNTTDKGLIFIEPQDDSIVDLKIDKPFFDRSKYIINFNDTVIRFIIVW
ncbi:MAG: hypothetical protein QXY96_01060 [Candidatus Methanomethylicaceae archaeon]